MSSSRIEHTDFISMNWLLGSMHPPDRIDPASLPIATLAYIGDAVQSFFAKIKFLSDLDVTQIHKKVARLVSRESQARCLEQILSQFSERELSVVKRALNSKCAKRYGNDADYRKSTALEALIGYLYLIGDRQKLMEILEASLRE